MSITLKAFNGRTHVLSESASSLITFLKPVVRSYGAGQSYHAAVVSNGHFGYCLLAHMLAAIYGVKLETAQDLAVQIRRVCRSVNEELSVPLLHFFYQMDGAPEPQPSPPLSSEWEVLPYRFFSPQALR